MSKEQKKIKNNVRYVPDKYFIFLIAILVLSSLFRFFSLKESNGFLSEDTFYHLSFINYLKTYHHLPNPTINGIYSPTHIYPLGFHIISYFFLSLSGLTVNQLIRVIPSFLAFLIGFICFFISKQIIKKNSFALISTFLLLFTLPFYTNIFPVFGFTDKVLFIAFPLLFLYFWTKGVSNKKDFILFLIYSSTSVLVHYIGWLFIVPSIVIFKKEKTLKKFLMIVIPAILFFVWIAPRIIPNFYIPSNSPTDMIHNFLLRTQ